MPQPPSDHPETPWQLRGQAAQLDLSGVEAVLDLSSPQQGLSDIAVLGSHVHGNVLAVEHGDAGKGAWGPLADYYERGADLVSVYEQTDDCPFRTTLDWRARGKLAHKAGAQVDLIVSVQTDSLDVVPQLRSHSRFSDAEVVLFPPSAGEYGLDLQRAMRLTDQSPHVPIGCVMLRLAEMDATYCELIHPSDWRGLEIRQRGETVELGWALVGHFMEKGVIRRLRVRGIFLAGRAKEQLVSDLYADFAGTPPPLAT